MVKVRRRVLVLPRCRGWLRRGINLIFWLELRASALARPEWQWLLASSRLWPGCHLACRRGERVTAAVGWLRPGRELLAGRHI